MNARLDLRRTLDPNIVACVAVTLLAGAYLASVAWKGWIPFDDGMLAQTAQRVLEGQLPHRDFDDVYTGGLSFFHAAAFQIAGSSLSTLRATLLLTTVASIPIWFFVASRFTPPLIASVVTFTAFAWSVPNYPAAMPSWYNLILAMCAIAATLRYIDTRRERWMFVAGVCAGLSILVKIVGVYLVAAIALFLAFELPSVIPTRDDTAARRAYNGSLAACAIVAILIVAPFLLVRAVLDARAVIELALPPALVATAALHRTASRARKGWHPPLRSIVRVYWPFAIGTVIPLATFAAIYWHAAALPALVRGVFILPQRRFALPSMHTPGGPPLVDFAFTLPLVLALTVAKRAGIREAAWHSAVMVAIGAAVVLISVFDHRVMVSVWLSVRMLMLPIAVLLCLRLLGNTVATDALTPRREALVLVASAAAWCSLLQFPYSAPIYFSYVAPLVIIAAVALASESQPLATPSGLLLIIAYAAYAVAVRPQLFPRRPELSPVAARINLPRGGIYVWPEEQRQYTELVGLLREHGGTGWILALPDVPEIYFLSGYRNPTRMLYDAFEDSAGRGARLVRQLRDHRIQAVVINRDPQVSGPIDRALDDSLTHRFPFSRRIGAFEVRWQ